MPETQLQSCLDEYARELQSHLVSLRERHQNLEFAWIRLRDIYEGEGAEVFAEAFETASARLADYVRDGAEVARLLEAKIEELRQFNAPRPEL